MPEAVIVAAARSPIGRAFKGSLMSIRPDDLTARSSAPRWTRSPSSTRRDRRPDARLRAARRRAGLQHGPRRRRPARLDHLPGTTITRYCSSSLQTTRMALHAIKAGEGDVFISAGVETVSRFVKGNSDSMPDTQNPVFADAQDRRGHARRERRRRLARPARRRLLPDIYIAMGQTAENLARLKGVTRAGHGRVRRPQPEPRREGDRQRLLGAGDHPGHDCPTARSSAPTTAPAPGTTLEARRQLKPVFRPDGRVTAGNACPLNDGAAALVIMSDTKAARARPDPAGPDRLHRRHRPVPGDHGLRPGRGVAAGAGPRRA